MGKSIPGDVPGLTFQAPVIRATFDGYQFGDWTYTQGKIPLDDAADLSNNVWGGAQVKVTWSSTMEYRRTGRVEEQWNVIVCAFILQEAVDIMYNLEVLFREQGVKRYQQYFSELPWRYRDGELVFDEIGALTRA